MSTKKSSCEICGIAIEDIIESHHIISKSKGGNNKKNNIAHICANCHSLVHRGKIIIEGRFYSTDGNILVWRNCEEKSITDYTPDVYVY